MGFFDKFKKPAEEEVGRKNEDATKPTTQSQTLAELELDWGDWQQVFSVCLGKVMAIQEACADHVTKGQDWNVDFSAGVISFGEREYPLQFIGSESVSSNTWLWGWENVNGFSEEILTVAGKVQQMGLQWGLEPLTTAEMELDDTINGHTLSIVTCGLLDGYCYYRGPHAGGAILVAFSGVPEEVFAPKDMAGFTTLTMQCIQQFSLSHKLFVEGLLRWNRTPYQWQGDTIIAQFQQPLHIKFEQIAETLRICSIGN